MKSAPASRGIFPVFIGGGKLMKFKNPYNTSSQTPDSEEIALIEKYSSCLMSGESFQKAFLLSSGALLVTDRRLISVFSDCGKDKLQSVYLDSIYLVQTVLEQYGDCKTELEIKYISSPNLRASSLKLDSLNLTLPRKYRDLYF